MWIRASAKCIHVNLRLQQRMYAKEVFNIYYKHCNIILFLNVLIKCSPSLYADHPAAFFYGDRTPTHNSHLLMNKTWVLWNFLCTKQRPNHNKHKQTKYTRAPCLRNNHSTTVPNVRLLKSVWKTWLPFGGRLFCEGWPKKEQEKISFYKSCCAISNGYAWKMEKKKTLSLVWWLFRV